MTKITILVSSAGRRVALIECFRESARAAGLELEVLACDIEPALSAACQAADRALPVPRCDDPRFIETLLEIAQRFGVDLLVPTIDPELMPLSVAADRFAAIGTQVHVSPPATIEIVRDKLRTAQVLGAANVPVPRTASLEAARAMASDFDWPAFVKPAGGSASRGIRIVQSPSQLPHGTEEPMILQQLLKGPEYTVNMFVDRDGELRSAVAHQRLRIRAGEVEKGRTKRHPVFRELAEGILRAMPQMRGVLCFQVIDDPQAGPMVFEINARFGGGYPLAHRAGAEFTRWLLEETAGLPSRMHDDWLSDVLMLRYDAAFFPTQTVQL
ncbi:ATP-grasp domain-containing protein [Pararhizobium mangrovi]|uniref:ATP-grasp domain-containing protein n=1 Tax=Pararhizobium mangrovi TaxID=2590452 RepID=A0A506UB39_9HYPH|nr:ATP-grasp domain-containing protein [Pararhizobium mangrovi]TPW29017.1 ATP-grasp domain-containing protein [Pararhizobium mangrovi]